MSNRNHATLCAANIKYLARNLVTLSKEKEQVSIKELEAAWPRNFLFYTDQNGKTKIIKDDVILIEGGAGSGKKLLSASLTPMNRRITYSDTTICSCVPIKNGSVIIIDGFNQINNTTRKPDMVESLLLNRKLSGTQIIFVSEGPLTCKDRLMELIDIWGYDGLTSIRMDEAKSKGGLIFFSVASHQAGFGVKKVVESDKHLLFSILNKTSHLGQSIGDDDYMSLPDKYLIINQKNHKIISSAFHHDIKHQEALNIVAKVAGYRDWHSLNGAFKKLSRDADISLTQKQPHDMM